MIRKHQLYSDKVKADKTAKKINRAKRNPKKRMTQLVKENKLWFLFQVDTIVIYWGNLKRYILTAVDHASKLGYVRMYKTLKYEWRYDCNLTTNCDEFNNG